MAAETCWVFWTHDARVPSLQECDDCQRPRSVPVAAELHSSVLELQRWGSRCALGCPRVTGHCVPAVLGTCGRG